MKIINIKISETKKAIITTVAEKKDLNCEITNIINLEWFKQKFLFEIIEIEFTENYIVLIKLKERKSDLYKLGTKNLTYLIDKHI